MPSSTLSVLGKYQILAEIGRGGFATVYRARDLDLSRDVALKVLDPLLTRDPVWVARFRREARAVAGLDHPRIVTIYEIGQAEGALYIAMKLLEGGSLAQRLAQQGPLPWPEVTRIAGEIAEALDYAHAQGVLHRDLKPGNVLLDPRSGAVLTDFGFARLVADNSLSISMSGGLVGTPAYIAPEIWEGQDATAQTDIYALGCIFYELVTGRTLFTGATPPAIMMAHFQPRAMPETWPDGTPPGLSEILRIALARDPTARFARAGDLAAAITALSVDPLAEPYAALEAAIAAGNWQLALELASEIRGQRNDYRDVVALEQRALAGVAQAARDQQAAQWRQAAEEALAAGRLGDARLAAKQWQQLTTDDPALAAFAARLEQATLTSQQTESWREQAEQALAAGDHRGAGFALNKWRRLTPDDPAVATFTTKLSESSRSEPPLASQPAESPTEHASSLPSTELDPVTLTPLADTTSPDHPSIDATEVIEPSTQFHSDDDPSRSDGTNESKWWLALVGGLLALIVVVVILLASQNSTSQPVPTWTPLPIFPITATPGSTDTPAPSPTLTLGSGSALISEDDGMEVVFVPAGEFIMGSPEGQGTDDEHPQHRVYLDAFYIDKTEVTAAQYRRCMKAGACSTPNTGGNCTYDAGSKSDHPINCVDWNQAVAFCGWTGKRLPTEAEWEKAARGTDGHVYPWGNVWNLDKLNSYYGGLNTTTSVGSYPAGASPYGALDMAGNVYEWVADWYDSGYYARPLRGNPQGSASGDYRVLRGGSWSSFSNSVRAAARFTYDPVSRVDFLGFRCVLSS